MLTTLCHIEVLSKAAGLWRSSCLPLESAANLSRDCMDLHCMSEATTSSVQYHCIGGLQMQMPSMLCSSFAGLCPGK